MNIETVKTAMIEQYKEMCKEFSETPRIEKPTFTYLGLLWDEHALSQRRFAAGQCEGARRLLKQILTDDEYNQLIDAADVDKLLVKADPE